MSGLVEQSVTLLGQANISLTYAHRLGILGRLTGDAKKAKKLLSKHESCLTQSQKSLFGKKFYKALRTGTKIRKSTKEISTHLSGSSRPRHAPFKGSASTRKEGFRQDTRPSHQLFRGGPPLVVGVGADLCHSGPEAPTTEDTLKASLSDLESKRDHLNQNPHPQMLTKTLGVQNQVVPVNVHPALTAMGMDTSILSRPLQLAGRLQHFLSNWKLLTQDQFILEMVVGIQIPFTAFPHQNQVPPLIFHNQSEKVVIDREISEMLQKGAIQVVFPVNGEFLSSIFLVKKKDGGNRPVINLKELNSYVTYQHFKMEGLYLLKHLVQTGDWMIKIDLKDAYFTVPVSNQHQPLLRFMHGGLRYQFSCLPFGLGPAPRLFTKLLKPVVALLRRLGLRLIIYLDVIIVFNQSQEGIVRDRDSTLWLLQHLGFVINWKKSVLHPAQSMENLGCVISSIEIKLFLPPGKMSQLVQGCKDLILERSASVRTLSRLLGN